MAKEKIQKDNEPETEIPESDSPPETSVMVPQSDEDDEDEDDLLSPIECDLDFRQVPVTLKVPDEDGGKPRIRRLIMRELDGLGREQYLNAIGMKIRTSDQGKVIGVKNFSGLESSLLSKCLLDSDNGKFVTEDEIRLWPSVTIQKLFTRAQKLNGLHKKAEAAAKNG